LDPGRSMLAAHAAPHADAVEPLALAKRAPRVLNNRGSAHPPAMDFGVVLPQFAAAKALDARGADEEHAVEERQLLGGDAGGFVALPSQLRGQAPGEEASDDALCMTGETQAELLRDVDGDRLVPRKTIIKEKEREERGERREESRESREERGESRESREQREERGERREERAERAERREQRTESREERAERREQRGESRERREQRAERREQREAHTDGCGIFTQDSKPPLSQEGVGEHTCTHTRTGNTS